MALSGTVSFNLTRAQVIQSAYELISVTAVGDTIPGELVDQASTVMNMMLKAWDADGLHLWKEYEGVVFPVVGKQSYLLGPSGDHACLLDDYVRTKADGAQTVTTSLVVLDGTDIEVGDTLGVVVDNVLNWTTVTGVSGETISIDTLGGVDVLNNAVVVAYTTLIERPTRILAARRNINGSAEAPIIMISRQEYMDLTQKSSQGAVVEAYYSPQLTNGKLYVWPTFGSANDTVSFTFERQLMDITESNQDFDIPQEWLEAITWGLAARLATYNHLPLDIAGDIRQQAEIKKAQLLAFDQEITALQIQPYDVWRRP